MCLRIGLFGKEAGCTVCRQSLRSQLLGVLIERGVSFKWAPSLHLSDAIRKVRVMAGGELRLRPWKTELFTFNQHQNLFEVRWNWFKIHDLINAPHSNVLTTGIIQNNIDISYTVVWTRSTHVLSPDIMHVYITNTKDDFVFLALLSSDDCSTSVSHCLNHYLLNHAMKFESWWLTIICLAKCTSSHT